MSCSALAAGAHARVEHVDEDGDLGAGPSSLFRVIMDVPFELASMAEASLDISAKLLQLQGPGGANCLVQAHMPVGFSLDPERSVAKYSKKRNQLIVTSPNAKSPSGTTPVDSDFGIRANALSTSDAMGTSKTASPSSASEREVSTNASPATDDDDDDDELPPLDAARSAASHSAETNVIASPAEAVAAWEASDRHDSASNDAAETLMQNALAARERKRRETEEAHKKSDITSAGGFKKGFLSGGGAKQKKKNGYPGSEVSATKAVVPLSQSPEVEDIPYISGTADPEAARKQSLQMPDVQQAMRQGANKLKEDQSWVTPNLMKALQSRPDLMAGLSNPRVMEAMSLMQTDPAGAQKKYKDDPDVTKFLKEFSGLMATHFDVLSKDPPTSKQTSTPAAPVTPAYAPVASQNNSFPSKAQEKAQEFIVMEKPEVQEAFQDPEVQTLLMELRAGRQLEMHELARSNPRLLHRVKILLDNGLLSFSHS